MSFTSEVNISDAGDKVDYSLTVRAWGTGEKTSGQLIEAKETFDVTEFFDSMGYCHYKLVKDTVIDQTFNLLHKKTL